MFLQKAKIIEKYLYFEIDDPEKCANNLLLSELKT